MRRRAAILVFLIAILCTLTLYACDNKDNISKVNKEKLENVQLPNQKDEYVDIDLYFDASKDEKNVAVAQQEILVNKEEVIGELIINHLIKGPSIESKLSPILPKDTKLLSFSIKDNIAIINLSYDASVKMSPGKEEACLRSIVKSLSQLSSIKKVQIMIGSKNIDTLGGNFDVSKPFSESEIQSLRIKDK